MCVNTYIYISIIRLLTLADDIFIITRTQNQRRQQPKSHMLMVLRATFSRCILGMCYMAASVHQRTVLYTFLYVFVWLSAFISIAHLLAQNVCDRCAICFVTKWLRMYISCRQIKVNSICMHNHLNTTKLFSNACLIHCFTCLGPWFATLFIHNSCLWENLHCANHLRSDIEAVNWWHI